MVNLILGDCLEKMGEMGAGKVDAIVTDPPYLLGAASARKSSDKALGWADVNNASYWYSEWMSFAWRLLKDDGSMWVFANWRSLPVLQCAASKIGGMSILSVIVWDKQWPGVGSMRGLRQNYEIIVLFGKPDFAIADRGLSDIWPCKWASARPSGHPQEKPFPLIVRALTVCDIAPGGLVCDPFMGSGSTGVAACSVGLDFIGIELEKSHFQTAERRVLGSTIERRVLGSSHQPHMTFEEAA